MTVINRELPEHIKRYLGPAVLNSQPAPVTAQPVKMPPPVKRWRVVFGKEVFEYDNPEKARVQQEVLRETYYLENPANGVTVSWRVTYEEESNITVCIRTAMFNESGPDMGWIYYQNWLRWRGEIK